MNYKFLTDDDCRYLIQLGHPQSDFKQIDEVAHSKHCKIKIFPNITMDIHAAIKKFGREKILKMLSRAAFHYTATMGYDVIMDCSGYFKN